MRVPLLTGLLPVLLCSLLTVSGWSAPLDLLPTQGDDDGDWEEALDMPLDEHDPGDMMDMGDPMAGPPFEEVIKDFKQIDGLLTFFQNEKTGQTLIALTPDQMEQEFLLSYTLNAGSGAGLFIAPMLWPDVPVYFKQTFRTVQCIVPNTYVRANPDSPIARAVKTGTADSILVSLPLMGQPKGKAQPAPEAAPEAKPEKKEPRRSTRRGRRDTAEASAPEPAPEADSEEEAAQEPAAEETVAELPEGTILIDAMMLLYSDLIGMSVGMGYLGGGAGMDPSGSFITGIKGFPENVNVEITANMVGGGFGFLGGRGLTPDPRSSIAKMVIVFSKLPKDNGYVPRLSDERIGYFLTMHQDYTSDKRDTRYVRYINRWHLEKKDPGAPVSDPVEPIVYWIENTVPHEYRAAVKEGVEIWQKAFEAAGFSNAIIAKQMPDDADWDPADIRYNTIRWFVAPDAGFAIGPSRANPYTGQIYDADIGFSADMLTYVSMEYRDVVTPLNRVLRDRQRLQLTGAQLPPLVTELREARMQQQQSSAAGQSAPLAAGQHLHGPGMLCDFAHEAAQEAAATWTMAQALRGEPIDEDAFVRQWLIEITAHEVGHTLGLRHNYKGSWFQSPAAIHTAEGAQRGISGSVMDYNGTNLAPAGQPQGEYFQTHLGPYDIQAIRYGYTPLPEAGGDPQQELPALQRIAAEWGKEGLGYATDEDQYGWTAAMDPSVVAWDLGRDNIAYYEDQLTAAKQLWDRLPTTHGGAGNRYQLMRRGFGWGLRNYAIASMGVPRYIGGIYHSRNRMGDPHASLPYTPVPAAEQRRALDFLIRHYWSPGAFDFPPQLLRSLAVEREPDFYGTTYMMQRRDLPIHDIVLQNQLMPLAWVYDPLTLRRLADSAKLLSAGTEPFTIGELFGAVRGAIWQEAFAQAPADSYRRNLQRLHLELVSMLYLYGGGWYPEDALTLARLDLITLRDALQKAAANAQLEGLSRAHYQESLERVNLVLKAEMSRFSFFMF